MGKTEALFNLIGHSFDTRPRPAIYIGPTEKQVRSVSGDRVSKMIASTPSLAAKLAGGHRDKITEKWISGVRLGFAWAGSATELASHPAAAVYVDERDRMEDSSGLEGDPVTLARARTKTYSDSLVVIVSTPTIEGASPIWSHWLEGSREAWAWPCPHCGTFFPPRLRHIVWPEDATPEIAYAEARLVCPECGGVIEEAQRAAMNAAGRMMPCDYTEEGELVAAERDAERYRTRSFWISGICSPWQTVGELAEILVSAYRSGIPEQQQAAINTYGGELWKVSGDRPRWQAVFELREPYAPRTIPDGAQIITLGADVQKRGIYFVVRGWGFNSESWLIDHGFIAGETEFDNVWVLFDRLFDVGHLNGAGSIQMGLIDSGYRPGDKLRRPDHQVYTYCRRQPRAFPSKGHDSLDRPVKMALVDLSIGGKTIKGGVKLWHLDTDYLKSWIYARLLWPAGEPGGWHVHRAVDEDYCRQIVSEEVLTKASGRRIWMRRNRDNHYLDAEANALAAALVCRVQTLRPIDRPAEKVKSETGPAAEPFIKRPGGPFIRR